MGIVVQFPEQPIDIDRVRVDGGESARLIDIQIERAKRARVTPFDPFQMFLDICGLAQLFEDHPPENAG